MYSIRTICNFVLNHQDRLVIIGTRIPHQIPCVGLLTRHPAVKSSAISQVAFYNFPGDVFLRKAWNLTWQVNFKPGVHGDLFDSTHAFWEVCVTYTGIIETRETILVRYLQYKHHALNTNVDIKTFTVSCSFPGILRGLVSTIIYPYNFIMLNQNASLAYCWFWLWREICCGISNSVGKP